MTRGSGRRRLACHHEAGHALVRWFFGHTTDRAVVLSGDQIRAGDWPVDRKGQVIPDCGGVVEGYLLHSRPFGPLDPSNAQLVHIRTVSRDIELINAAARVAAQAHCQRRSSAVCVLAGGIGDYGHMREILNAWGIVGDESRTATRLAERRATVLVRSSAGATAIRAMADALIDRGEIDGKEIADICRAAYGGRQPDFGCWTDHWPPSLADLRAGRIPVIEPMTSAFYGAVEALAFVSPVIEKDRSSADIVLPSQP